MIYSFTITTPANTPATAKQETVLTLERGVTYKVEILFPPGPAGTLHLQVRDALHSVWPTNADEDFTGDESGLEFEDEYSLEFPPYELVAYTWNDSTDYEHKVIIRVGVVSLPIVLGPQLQEPLYFDSYRIE